MACLKCPDQSERLRRSFVTLLVWFFFFRNAVLESSIPEHGYKAPRVRKTGTTIAGLVYKVGTPRLCRGPAPLWAPPQPSQLCLSARTA